MAKPLVDIVRKAVNDAGIAGKNWRKVDAYDDFTLFFNGSYDEGKRQAMKYDEILKISKAWWEEHHSKYS
jgi:hypothetical protein